MRFWFSAGLMMFIIGLTGCGNSPQNAPVISLSEKARIQEKIRIKAKQEKRLATEKGIQWNWPVKGPILRQFHEKHHSTKGIDIAGQMGTPIKAAAEGVVVYSGNGLKGYGNLIIIKHTENYLSVYAHNHNLKVKEGERVISRQVIADMGQTDANQVNLHFEIRVDGKPIDPIKYLPKLG